MAATVQIVEKNSAGGTQTDKTSGSPLTLEATLQAAPAQVIVQNPASARQTHERDKNTQEIAPAYEEHVQPPSPRRGGMSYDQVLAATLGYRKAQELLAEQRKKKRRGRRAREREMLLFSMQN